MLSLDNTKFYNRYLCQEHFSVDSFTNADMVNLKQIAISYKFDDNDNHEHSPSTSSSGTMLFGTNTIKNLCLILNILIEQNKNVNIFFSGVNKNQQKSPKLSVQPPKICYKHQATLGVKELRFLIPISPHTPKRSRVEMFTNIPSPNLNDEDTFRRQILKCALQTQSKFISNILSN